MELRRESRYESVLVSPSWCEVINLKKLHPSLKKAHVQMELKIGSRYEFVLASPSGYEALNLNKLPPSLKKHLTGGRGDGRIIMSYFVEIQRSPAKLETA